ncbi:LytR/AlgR family response regulator transcription factor [Pedobacter punctiformis]|uniref:LytTR family DNA-binding domain-containing protein n=1 Tax=Pedobacter punctiformis TaxID=3004097 RepID=A0ABT4L6P2_9SPHI|nr:LytTR family DNA-binding domain-containing protein [Pedobacter sp. HCMS5-2]MCZ4243591.1 LytTR family DNA-binding domain-containing protein [Pedobacter sp. HCMS5-2]
MSKLKCYIIDDEQRAINALEFLLDYYCSKSVEVIGTNSIFNEALEFLEQNTPDILFLDIKLGEETGFNLLEKLGPLPETDIIIISAYGEHALEAFKYGTVNYLLKPVDPEELAKTINRLEARKQKKPVKQSIDPVSAENFFYPTRHGYSSINYKDIICLKGDGSYTNIHLIDTEPIIVSKNLFFFEQLLEKRPEFLRVQKSYIINKNHIKEINKQGGIKLIMKGDIHVPISNSMKDVVMEIIGY